MMEDTWLCIDEHGSSDGNFSDSDEINSEIEAELYSIIHFEQNLSSVSCHTSDKNNVHTRDGHILTSDVMKNVLSTENNRNNGESELVCNAECVIQNDNESTGKKISSKTVFLNKLVKNFSPQENKDSDPNHKVPEDSLLNNDSNLPQSSKDTSLNIKKKRKLDHSLPNCSNSLQKNSILVTDSSDSDSDSSIWIEEDLFDKKSIQTNMHKGEETIYISSEPENDCEPLSKKRKSNLQNISMPNIKIGQNSKDLWFINQEDIHRPKNKARRYHDNYEIICSNCNSKGHHNRVCPYPKSIKCYICGGGHIGNVCTNRICGKCYGTGHDSRHCQRPLSYCDLCHYSGHTKEKCPDLWRRYHLTTRPGKIVRGKQIKRHSFLYCCNCGEEGHFGAICNQDFMRGYKNSFPTWPSVLSYDEPKDLGGKRPKEFKDQFIKKEKASPRKWKNKPNEENVNVVKKEKKNKKNKLQLLNSSDNKQVIREKNFPRTPKNNSSVSDPSSDTVPESVRLLMFARERRREKNRIRRLKRRQNLAKGNEQRLQGNV